MFAKYCVLSTCVTEFVKFVVKPCLSSSTEESYNSLMDKLIYRIDHINEDVSCCGY